MKATKSQGAVKDPVTRTRSTAGQATEMESEGQGQSMSVPPQASDARGRKRAAKGVESADTPEPVGNVDTAADGARADQDIDTAGTELDDER
jgi:hypothetical protein